MPGAMPGALHMFSHHGGSDTYLPFRHEEMDSEWQRDTLWATHLANGRIEVGPQVCLLLSTLLCYQYIANQLDCYVWGVVGLEKWMPEGLGTLH